MRKRVAGGGQCKGCGSLIEKGLKQDRYENLHLCKDCNGETKVEFMPTLEHIAAEKEAIRTERLNFIAGYTDPSPHVYTPRVFPNPMNSRMRARGIN